MIKDLYPTVDDPDAFINALAQLETMVASSNLHTLEWSDGIALAARDHCADASKTGSQYLLGSDGSMTWGRISRYGKAPASVGEVLAFGLVDATDIVMQLFTDYGERSRGQRDKLMSPKLTHTGIATCRHPGSENTNGRTTMTDIAYAEDF
jgi:uncharacterized protein YkwD